MGGQRTLEMWKTKYQIAARLFQFWNGIKSDNHCASSGGGGTQTICFFKYTTRGVRVSLSCLFWCHFSIWCCQVSPWDAVAVSTNCFRLVKCLMCLGRLHHQHTTSYHQRRKPISKAKSRMFPSCRILCSTMDRTFGGISVSRRHLH